MQSYLDVSLILVVTIAVFLLISILCSFILSTRRANALEQRLNKLTQSVSKLEEKLYEVVEKNEHQKEEIALLRTRLAQSGVIKNQPDFAQSFKEANEEINYTEDSKIDLEEVIETKDPEEPVKPEVSTIQTENTRIDIVEKKEEPVQEVKPNPINDARDLIKQGLSVEEVVEQTGLPLAQVEMLFKIYEMSQKVAKKREMIEQLSQEEEPTPVKVEQPVVKASHAANLKARDAYGIGTRSVLRRHR